MRVTVSVFKEVNKNDLSEGKKKTEGETQHGEYSLKDVNNIRVYLFFLFFPFLLAFPLSGSGKLKTRLRLRIRSKFIIFSGLTFLVFYLATIAREFEEVNDFLFISLNVLRPRVHMHYVGNK